MRIVPMTCGNINADELAEVIRRLSHDDPQLTDLTMSWSNLGDSGLEKVGDALRYNNYLVDLDVYSNNVSSAGLVKLAVALEFNTTLRSLNLEWNPIGEEGASILLKALRRGNTSLTELNIGSCGVSLATQRVLQENVSANRTSMLAKSQKSWVPGSIEPKPPAPPVRPPWQVAPFPHHFLPMCDPSRWCLNLRLQPVPIIRKTETTSRDGEVIPRTHAGPPNLGDRFRHAFLADPIHDRHVKPPSLAKPSNKFTPDLAR